MGNALKTIELLAVILWLGSMLFFSFVVAPSLFKELGAREAGQAVRTIFPRYYVTGILCGIILLAVVATRGALWGWTGMQPPSMVLFLLLTLIVVLARQVLTPAINAARDAGPTAEHRFRRLHRTSVVLNAFVILLLLVYVLWMASRGY